MFAFLHKKQPALPVPLASRLSYDKLLTYFEWIGGLDALCHYARQDTSAIDWDGIQESLEDLRVYLNDFMDTAK